MTGSALAGHHPEALCVCVVVAVAAAVWARDVFFCGVVCTYRCRCLFGLLVSSSARGTAPPCPSVARLALVSQHPAGGGGNLTSGEAEVLGRCAEPPGSMCVCVCVCVYPSRRSIPRYWPLGHSTSSHHPLLRGGAHGPHGFQTPGGPIDSWPAAARFRTAAIGIWTAAAGL